MLTAVAGQVVNDVNDDGLVDAGDVGQDLVEVYADANGNGQLDIVGDIVEPDRFADGAAVTGEGLTFSVVGVDGAVLPGRGPVVAHVDAKGLTFTGDQVFGYQDAVFFNNFFRLRIDFATPVSSVQLGFTGESELLGDVGTLQAYDSNDNLLGRFDTRRLTIGKSDLMEVSRPTAEIAYVQAYTNTRFDGDTGGLTGRIDSLRINGTASEPWTLTDRLGDYNLVVRDGGEYTVREVVPAGFQQTIPAGDGGRVVTVAAAETVIDVDFGNVEATQTNGWQNPVNPLNVDDDLGIFPIDALLIINELNNPVYRDPVTGLLPPAPDPVPAFFDVDGDGFVSPSDAILIINFLNDQARTNAAKPAVTKTTSPQVATPAVVVVEDSLRKTDIAAVVQIPTNRIANRIAPRNEIARAITTVLPPAESMEQGKRQLDAAHVDSLFSSER